MASNLDSSQIDTVLASIRQLEQGTTTTARNDDDNGDDDNNYNNDGSKLNILRLGGPITGQSSRMDAHSPSTENAADNANGDTTQDLTPSMLEDDLAHYKELFSKLRFSYVEQVTKERYLRGIVGDPPLVVGHEENLELEEKLGEKKAELKRHKEDIARQVDHVADVTNDLAKRHQNVEEKVAILSEIPAQIESLKSELETLKNVEGVAEEKPVDDNALGDYTNMSLETLRETLNQRNNEIKSTESQLTTIKTKLEHEVTETGQIEAELERLQQRKEQVMRALHDETENQGQGGASRVETERQYRRMQSILQMLAS